MKICTDCKWYFRHPEWHWKYGYKSYRELDGCAVKPNPVTGGRIIESAYEMRSEDGDCGLEGDLWHAKEGADDA